MVVEDEKLAVTGCGLINPLEAVFLGLTQALTEWLPISVAITRTITSIFVTARLNTHSLKKRSASYHSSYLLSANRFCEIPRYMSVDNLHFLHMFRIQK